MMADEFTVEKLKEIIRAARIFNHSFGQEQFRSLTELQGRLAERGYPETVSGLLKLEKETGTTLSQVFETRDRLLQQNGQLERRVTARNTELKAQEELLTAMEERHRHITRAIQDEAKQLEELRRERAREGKELVAFKKRAAAEKQRIDKELAEHHRKADVLAAEVATAGQVKAEMTRHGFTLDLALGIAAEFAGYTNSRERLAEALQKFGKLTTCLTALEADTKTLSENQRHMQGVLSHQAKEQEQHEMVLAQLKAEIAEKGKLVGFYHSYVHLQSLIEYLGSWTQVTFHHCMWCGALFWVLRPGNVPSSTYKCSWCGLTLVDPDNYAYAAVGQPPGTPLKLLP